MTQVRPTFSDEEFSLPKHRRNLFEHGEDITRMNWYLLIVTLVSLLLSCILGGILLSIYLRPPYVLAEDNGYVMYRDTVIFTLDESRMKTYLDMILTKLFNSNPGVYDLSEMVPFVDHNIIEGYTKYYNANSSQRASENERRLFHLLEVRQFPTDSPKQIIAIVKGDMAIFRDSKVVLDAATGTTANTTRVTSQVSTYLVYLDVVRPTPTNPWGLITRNIIAPKADAANNLWDHSTPFFKTVQNGQVLPRIQRDSLLESALPDSSSKNPQSNSGNP